MIDFWKNKNILLFFTACPVNQIRFGDYCYEELETKKQTIEENANQCEDKLGQGLPFFQILLGFLWAPQGPEEFVIPKILYNQNY